MNCSRILIELITICWQGKTAVTILRKASRFVPRNIGYTYNVKYIILYILKRGTEINR